MQFTLANWRDTHNCAGIADQPLHGNDKRCAGLLRGLAFGHNVPHWGCHRCIANYDHFSCESKPTRRGREPCSCPAKRLQNLFGRTALKAIVTGGIVTNGIQNGAWRHHLNHANATQYRPQGCQGWGWALKICPVRWTRSSSTQGLHGCRKRGCSCIRSSVLELCRWWRKTARVSGNTRGNPQVIDVASYPFTAYCTAKNAQRLRRCRCVLTRGRTRCPWRSSNIHLPCRSRANHCNVRPHPVHDWRCGLGNCEL